MGVKIPRRLLGTEFIVCLIGLLLIGGFISIKGAIDRHNEKIYSNESKLNDPVYADIVSIEPVSSTHKERQRSTQTIEGYFCSCETDDGKEFTAYIDYYAYKKHIKDTRFGLDAGKEEFDPPLRIHGKIFTRKDILNNKFSSDTSLVFKITSVDTPKK